VKIVTVCQQLVDVGAGVPVFGPTKTAAVAQRRIQLDQRTTIVSMQYLRDMVTRKCPPPGARMAFLTYRPSPDCRSAGGDAAVFVIICP
jgi:hypothetical protein